MQYSALKTLFLNLSTGAILGTSESKQFFLKLIDQLLAFQHHETRFPEVLMKTIKIMDRIFNGKCPIQASFQNFVFLLLQILICAGLKSRAKAANIFP